MNPTRIERIRELLLILKQGYDWCHKNKRNEERKYDLFDRSMPIFKELETLDVSRSFSACVFFFGLEITDKLVNQFEEKGEEVII